MHKVIVEIKAENPSQTKRIKHFFSGRKEGFHQYVTFNRDGEVLKDNIIHNGDGSARHIIEYKLADKKTAKYTRTFLNKKLKQTSFNVRYITAVEE